MLAATTEKVEISERFLVTMRHGEAAEVPNDQSLLPGEPLGTVLVSKNRGTDFTPKMDGENNGKPYEQMDDLGGKPTIFGNIQFGQKKLGFGD